MSSLRTDKNTELMRAMGSKTGRYDPESPDQWLYLLRNGEAEERALAWVKSKTIAFSRSPWCADEHGKALYVENMAADLEWGLQTARNVLHKLAEQGRVRLDDVKPPAKPKIWYSASVPQVTRRIKRDERNFVQTLWSPYIVDSIESLPAEKRAWIEAQAEPFLKWQEVLIADALAAARSVIERIEDSMLRQVGIEKKRLPPRPAKRASAVQMSLLQVPEFVQSYAPDFVQTAQAGSYEIDLGSVRGGPSLLTSDPDPDSTLVSQSGESGSDRRTKKTSRSSNPSNEDAVAEILTRKLSGVLQEIPKPKLCADITSALNGAPLELLERKIEHVLTTRPQKFTSMGLVELLAHDVGRAWQHGAAARQRDAEALQTRDLATLDQTLSIALKTLEDPNASESEKEFARELLAGRTASAATAGGAL